MLRLVAVSAAIAVITAALIPPQWLAVKLRLRARRLIPVVYHRLLCRLLGVRVRVIGTRAVAPKLLIVANHVSWLDISVLVALAPVVFVAKHEVAAWPLFGLLAKLNRSVFVARERRSKTAEVNREIAVRLAEGDPVVLFAEGTSSDGNRVLPFRSSLIAPAQAAHGADALAVQPLSIAYVGLDGVPMGRQHRPRVAWYGAMDLLPHLAEVIRRGAIDVVVTWGEPMQIEPAGDRKAVARALETDVRRMTTTALRRM
jgi:1-acyl-sn-glycerol-3-phosphate acyltransferase